MTPTSVASTKQLRPPTGDREARLRRMQQGLIDVELRASRRTILAAFRERLRTDPATLAADEFLALADRAVVESAILVAARTVGGADACDLQAYEPGTGVLRITRHRGFPPAFLDYFATVDPDVPSACGTALAIGDPVLIDDITTSPIFRGQPTLDVMLAAGTRAVQSYPLRDKGGALLGMLSLHYRTTGRHPGQEQLIWAAAQAIAKLPARQVPVPPSPADVEAVEYLSADGTPHRSPDRVFSGGGGWFGLPAHDSSSLMP